MAAIQLNFTLRTSANVKTVHLLGSWDNYNGQLPLSKDSSKTGGWKGTFRFQGQTLKQGQRYWYYYIIDGYHVSHDPARESVTEPTTGRKLNTLDIPTGKAAEPTTTRSSKESRQSRHARHSSSGVPKGRPLDKSQIISPKPYKPQESYKVRNEQFAHPTMEQLTAKFARQQVADESSEEDSEDDSDNESDVPSLSSRSSGGSSVRSGASSPSSVSSTSSCCSCERYGITRSGNRVKLDCGGSRCGYSDGSDCSSESEDDYKRGATRRHGVVVRH
ncbi:Putative immunoglobulin-like protein [Septoria linicola]|uniref:Immunoglobulin-like protein n=1 Tax=Septoria linicola TaxID=215465 RepID=A0A9Q9EKW3_9PEZI|nr:putative immunoglobulin-like protein [Septoria linicola]USW53699.1 Putative immunoglobulin-like protein [Septoria linicola]